jgi:hypothetical protein
MTPKALKVHLKHTKALKINSFVASIMSFKRAPSRSLGL